MAVLDFLKEAAEDLLALEVATLTNPTSAPIPLKKPLPDGGQAKLDAANAKVDSARDALVQLISNNGERSEIRAARKALRIAKKELSELEEALGVYNPKDIFSAIQTNLDNGELVAYSRLEIEGDSVNFVNNKESLKDIVASHKDMVAASQEARKALFDAVAKLFPNS
ncbi:MAG: hypothetical protein Roseis2KO_59480 [Roseivirga sp.]